MSDTHFLDTGLKWQGRRVLLEARTNEKDLRVAADEATAFGTRLIKMFEADPGFVVTTREVMDPFWDSFYAQCEALHPDAAVEEPA